MLCDDSACELGEERAMRRQGRVALAERRIIRHHRAAFGPYDPDTLDEQAVIII
jgi:hypothetical protein